MNFQKLPKTMDNQAQRIHDADRYSFLVRAWLNSTYSGRKALLMATITIKVSGFMGISIKIL